MEMTPKECVAKIHSLLELYPGVHVVSATHSDATRMSYIRLRITSLQSFVRITHHCQAGANLPMNVATSGITLPRGQSIDESSCIYFVHVPDDDGQSSFKDPPAPLHILGIYLARDLLGLGLIPESDSEDLQRAWHGYGTQD
jgi:hypothetical protein